MPMLRPTRLTSFRLDMLPTLISGSCTPLSMRRRSVSGFLARMNRRWASYLPAWMLAEAFASGSTESLTDAGQAILRTCFCMSSVASWSSTTMKRETCLALAQRLATWPWMRRKSMRTPTIMGYSSPSGTSSMTGSELSGSTSAKTPSVSNTMMSLVPSRRRPCGT